MPSDANKRLILFSLTCITIFTSIPQTSIWNKHQKNLHILSGPGDDFIQVDLWKIIL